MRHLILLLLLLTTPAYGADFPSIPDHTPTFDTIEAIRECDLSRYPGIMPCPGRCASSYGFRRDPFTHRIAFHAGKDIANREGTVIVAVASGTVVYAGPMSGYGYVVFIQHTSRLTTVYGHLMVVGVYVGEDVVRGQPIGLMGSTGRSTGNHVHYETRIGGMPVDPESW